MTEFTPVSALLGGLMIGAAALLLMALFGRIAGISGIVGGLLRPQRGEIAWRLAFVAGLLLAPWLYVALSGRWPTIDVTTSPWAVVVAGLLVGVGTRMGSGCTSGHGVCGIARLSPRSLIAAAVFIAAGVVMATFGRSLLGMS